MITCQKAATKHYQLNFFRDGKPLGRVIQVGGEARLILEGENPHLEVMDMKEIFDEILEHLK